jgi:serine/threonine-protein kinase RsbT
VLCEDSGPGIEDVELAMQDGHSTRGGLGGGLSGARRLMDEFEIRSQVGVGTIVIARMWRR